MAHKAKSDKSEGKTDVAIVQYKGLTFAVLNTFMVDGHEYNVVWQIGGPYSTTIIPSEWIENAANVSDADAPQGAEAEVFTDAD